METEFDKVYEVSHQFHDDQNADESSWQISTIGHKRSVRDLKRPKWMDDFVSYNVTTNFAREAQTFVETYKFIETTRTHNCTKHIDVRHDFVQEAVEKGLIKVKYMPTNEMFGDVLT